MKRSDFMPMMVWHSVAGGIVACCMFVAVAPGVRSDTFFVDGYHGGIYGHYPVEWKTQFIVDQLDRNPGWYVGLEIEPETWDTVRVRTPEAYQRFDRMLASGRMEYTNPAYAQPYCYNIQGESIIRQFSYGIEKLREHFPYITFSTYAVEEPCFTSCLPAILKGFGFKYASLKCPNTCWGGYMAPFGGQLVDWQGADGTTILTVPRYACEELEPGSVWQTTAWGNSPKYLKACREAGIDNPVGMCYQDAGWRNGPWLGADAHGSTYVLWTGYIEDHTPQVADARYVMSQDDVKVNLMWGSQALQRIARQVRRAENHMIQAEKIGFISAVTGNALIDSDKVDEAWRQLMLSQHHDSWIVPYNGLWHYGTWADAIAGWTGYANGVAGDEIARLAASVDSGNRLMVKVFNTTLQTREEPVKIDLPASLHLSGKTVQLIDSKGRTVRSVVVGNSDGSRTLVFKPMVGPLGYSTYSVSVVADSQDIAVEDAGVAAGSDQMPVIENDKVRLVIDLANGGAVASMMLKEGDGVEFAPDMHNDRKLCELRGFFYDEGRFRSSTESPARVIACDDNGLTSSLTVEGDIAGNPYRLTYSLVAGSPRVDCNLLIDWQGNPGIGEYREKHWRDDRRAYCDDRYKLCLLMPTSFDASRLWKDAPFDVCESHQESSYFDRWSRIKHNVILNWIDTGDRECRMGLGLFTDHTTSYVHGPDTPTALTIQYSGQGLWGPDYRIDGPTEVNFALLPHCGCAGAEAMWAEADRYNEPLQAVMCGGSGRAESRSLAGVDVTGYRLSSAVVDRSGRAVMRLHNVCAGSSARLSVGFPYKTVSEVDLLGNELRSNVSDGRHVTVDIARNGFTTFSMSLK